MKLLIEWVDTPSRQVDLHDLTVEHETRRQRHCLEMALVALGKGDTDTVKRHLKSMELNTL